MEVELEPEADAEAGGAAEGMEPSSASNRGPGRPKGLGRVPGSGRAKGTANRVTADLRARLGSSSVAFLCKIAEGRRVRVGPQAGPGEPAWVYPSLQNRIDAARALLDKTLPSLRAAEITGADGGPIEATVTHYSPDELAAAWAPVRAALRIQPAPLAVVSAPQVTPIDDPEISSDAAREGWQSAIAGASQ